MIFRVRLPSNTQKIEIEDSLPLNEFLFLLENLSEIPRDQIEIKAGFPPTTLELSNSDKTCLKDVQGLKSGETLIIQKKSEAEKMQAFSKDPVKFVQESKHFDTTSMEQKYQDLPKYYIQTKTGYLIMREILDDNSCLFRSITIREVILANPTEYNSAVLGMPVQEYCDWIMKPTTWGGAIELKILSSWFKIEICSIDIKTQVVYRFGQELYKTRAIVLYNGIHYNVISFNPRLEDSDISNDESIFSVEQDEMYNGAVKIAKKIKE
ncbi:hypothetical protein BB560_003536, partial [Smittium megazygosporum]